VYADKEGSIEEEEEDLATPGTSQGKKRAAPGEGDLFETPKAKRPATSQLTGKSLFHRVPKHNVKDKKQIYWDLRLTEFIVGNNLPYELVSSNSSKRWYEEFQPQYHLKHATTFSRNKMPLLYLNVKAAMDKKLEKQLPTCQGVAFTADFWTSTTADPYLGMTMHYVDQDFTLHRIMVACKLAEGRHTAINIASKLDKVVSEVAGLKSSTTR
jgi:hypothetical protein